MFILYSKMVILKRVTTPTDPHPLSLTHKNIHSPTSTYPHPPIKIVQAPPSIQKITPPPPPLPTYP